MLSGNFGRKTYFIGPFAVTSCSWSQSIKNVVDNILEMCHDSILVSHKGVVKTYLTINEMFYSPGLMHQLYGFVCAC